MDIDFEKHVRARRPSLEIMAEHLAAEEHGDRGASWSFGPVLALFAIGWAFLTWPWLSGRFLIPWDAKAHFAPQIQFLAQSLARGESPFWLPYAFAGSPQIADPQAMIFSPPFLVLAAVNGNPSLHAIDVTLIVSLLVIGAGVIWLARDLGWHWGGALVAALGFCFGAAMAWRLQHFGQILSLGYLPFAWLFLRRALIGASVSWGALAGLAAALIVLGRDQVGLLALYVLSGYAIGWLATAERPAAALLRVLPALAVGAIVAVAVAGPPILLTWLYAAQSNRPEIDFIGAGRGSLHPALIVTAFAPHLFGAAGEMEKYWGPPSFAWQGTDLFVAQNMGQLYVSAPLVLLVIAGLARGVLWAREARFITVTLALVTLYALGWFTPAFRLAYEVLPGVKLYRRPADAVFLIGAFASLAAGYVAHRLLSGTLPPAGRIARAVEVGLPVAALLAGLAFAVRLDRVAMALPPLALAAGCLAAGALALAAVDRLRLLRPVGAVLLLSAVVVADLALNNGPNGATAMAPAELDMLEPDTRSPTIALLKSHVTALESESLRPRVELIGFGFHWPNATLTHRLEGTLGYNPVRLALYSAAVGAGNLPDERRFPPLFPSYRSRLADLLGLRLIAAGRPLEEIDKALRPGDLTLLARTADGWVYENPRALPRVLFAHQSQSADFDQLITSGLWPEFDPAATVLLGAPRSDAGRRPGRASIQSYANTEIVIEAESPDGGWVVLNDLWHPWWRATIDGAPARIERANVLFRAVEVAPGRRLVRFTFAPVRGAWHELQLRLVGERSRPP